MDAEPGSLEVDVDWDDVAGADTYLVRWRVAGPGNELNEGERVPASEATVTVDGVGSYVVRVQACNNDGCGSPAAADFEVAAAPTTTTVPPTTTTVAPQEPPGTPTGLTVGAGTGSLDVLAGWDDTPGADSYLVRWRVAEPGSALNDGVEVSASEATVTVDDYGWWIVRVEACNDAGCGPPAAATVAVAAADGLDASSALKSETPVSGQQDTPTLPSGCPANEVTHVWTLSPTSTSTSITVTSPPSSENLGGGFTSGSAKDL